MKRDFSWAPWLNSVSVRFISGLEHKRRAVLESLGWTFAKPLQPLVHDAKKLGHIAMAAPGDCLLELGSSPNGLTESEAEVRLKTIGLNEVAHERQATWHRQLFHAFNTPFNWLLVFLALLSFLTDDLKATVVLSVMVGLSSVLRFVQEFRSTKAAEKLQAMVSTTVTVRRIDDLKERAKEYADAVGIAINGRSIEYREIPLKFLVPGDVVRLSAGDMVPADVRLLSSKDLFISQATLTGEAFPVEKSSETVTREIKNALELPNICFMGSNVISGSATAVVVNTGSSTYFGGLSQNIVGHREPTEFDKGIHRVSWLLIRFLLVMAPVVLLDRKSVV
jgi:Mg2+-importing ATPase